jgi:folate-dependent phosphoribosylglycinamide formyltransferase PurN
VDPHSRGKKGRLVVLTSDGALLQPLLDACASGRLQAEIAAVIAGRPEADALQVARRARVHALAKFKPRSQEWRTFDAELAEIVSSFHPHWILLADWSRDLTGIFYDRFPDNVLTLSPALPGTLTGSHAVERAYYAYCRGELDRTGVTVYRGPYKDAAGGEVVGQLEVIITPEDTLESLEDRIRKAGAELLAAAMERVLRPTREIK